MTNDFEVFRDRLYFFLNEQNLTLNKLAKKSDIRQSTLSTMLNKERLPRLDMLHSMCDALNISVQEFLDIPPYNNKETSLNNLINQKLKPEQAQALQKFIESL